jgi:hypothetical protein
MSSRASPVAFPRPVDAQYNRRHAGMEIFKMLKTSPPIDLRP